MNSPPPPWLESAVARPARNWVFLAGLAICSVTVAGLGVFGWVAARPSLPLLICAASFCVAAQIVAACCGANFGRHTWRAAGFTRMLLLCGYLAAAAFATFSADQGWMAATSGPHIAAAAARANERGRLEAEIAEREAYVRVAEGQRARVVAPGPMLTAQLQAPYTETIARNEARLRELRAALEAIPPLPPERTRTELDWAAFLAFGLWQILEPWLYHAVEAGRRGSPIPSRVHKPNPQYIRGRIATAISIAAASAPAVAYPATHTEGISHSNQAPIMLAADMSQRAVAFSMRGRFHQKAIANKLGVSQSTISRWFAARDKAMAEAA